MPIAVNFPNHLPQSARSIEGTMSQANKAPDPTETSWISEATCASHSHHQGPPQSSVPFQTYHCCPSGSVHNVAQAQAASTQNAWLQQRVSIISGTAQSLPSYTLACGPSDMCNVLQPQAARRCQNETGRDSAVPDASDTLGIRAIANQFCGIGGWTCPPRAAERQRLLSQSTKTERSYVSPFNSASGPSHTSLHLGCAAKAVRLYAEAFAWMATCSAAAHRRWASPRPALRAAYPPLSNY